VLHGRAAVADHDLLAARFHGHVTFGAAGRYESADDESGDDTARHPDPVDGPARAGEPAHRVHPDDERTERGRLGSGPHRRNRSRPGKPHGICTAGRLGRRAAGWHLSRREESRRQERWDDAPDRDLTPRFAETASAAGLADPSLARSARGDDGNVLWILWMVLLALVAAASTLLWWWQRRAPGDAESTPDVTPPAPA